MAVSNLHPNNKTRDGGYVHHELHNASISEMRKKRLFHLQRQDCVLYIIPAMSGMKSRPDNSTVARLILDSAINTRALISNVQDGDNLGAGPLMGPQALNQRS